jgi:hypothetical protein
VAGFELGSCSSAEVSGKRSVPILDKNPGDDSLCHGSGRDSSYSGAGSTAPSGDKVRKAFRVQSLELKSSKFKSSKVQEFNLQGSK